MRMKTVVVSIRMPESERDRLGQEAEEAGFNSVTSYLRTKLGVVRPPHEAPASLLARIEALEATVAKLSRLVGSRPESG